MDETNNEENCNCNVDSHRNIVGSIDVARLVAVLGKSFRKRTKFKELTLFNSKYEIKGFQYVILKKECPKVAFLSGQERKLLSEKRDTSRLGCDQTISPKETKLGPGYYTGAEKFSSTTPKIFSKVGYGALASKSLRITQEKVTCSPGPQAYHIKTTTPGKSKCLAPFNSSTVRDSKLTQVNESPGVGSYDITYIDKSHAIGMEHSFGGRVKLKQIVNVECKPTSDNVCKNCGHKINGDFWRKNEDLILCHSCYKIQYYKKSYTQRQLDEFQKTRDCSFMHLHDGTTATYPLMTKKEYWMQSVNENYFSTYTETRNIKQVEPATNKRKSRTEYTKADASRAEELSHSFPFLKHLDDKPTADILEKKFLSKEEIAAFFEPITLVPDMKQLMEEWKFEPYNRFRSCSVNMESKSIDLITEPTCRIAEFTDPKAESTEPIAASTDNLADSTQHIAESKDRLEESTQEVSELINQTTESHDQIAASENQNAESTDEIDQETASKDQITECIHQVSESSDQIAEKEPVEIAPGIKLKQSKILDKYAEENRIPFDEPTTCTESLIEMIGIMESAHREDRVEIEIKKEKPINTKVEMKMDKPEIEERPDEEEDEKNEGVEEEEELILTQDPNIPPLPRIHEGWDPSLIDPEVRSLLTDDRLITPDDRSFSLLTLTKLNLDKISYKSIKILDK